MAQQIINIGTADNDGTGDPARTAFNKTNQNFTELYGGGAGSYAPLASPVFTGDPQAPTPPVGDNDTSIATTAFVKNAVTAANQVFYCDLTDAADVATYKRMLLTPSTHAETSATAVCTGTTTDFLIASFITDPGVPGAISFPAGSAYRRLYGSVSGGAAVFRLQVYSRTAGGVETLARDEFSNTFSDTVATLQEWLATPSTGGTLLTTDRLVAKVSARRVSGPTNVTVTLYSEGTAHASQIQTTITSGSSAPISVTPPLALTGGNLTIDLSGYQPPPQGRLTLQTATPVMTTTQSAKTTIFYTPYQGNKVPIYDGTNFAMTSIGAEISAVTTDTTKSPAAIGASKVNDWFVWSDGGTILVGHGPDWTSDTARSAGTALTMVNGIWLNSVSITNGPAASRGTYVGTTRSNASSQLDWKYGTAASPPGEMWFGVWNAYNRVNVAAFCGDTTSNWTSTNVTPHAANAAGSASGLTFRASFIVGLNEDGLLGIYSTHSALSSGTGGTVGIGYDSTSVFSTSGSAQASSTSLQSAVTAEIATTPAIGWHFIQALEAATTAGTAAFYGAFQQSMSKLFFNYRM